LREKEEIGLQLSSYEDKVQKMDLDRETLKLRNKQIAAESQRNLQLSEELNLKIGNQNRVIAELENEEKKAGDQLEKMT
jgi:hypothetical protein